jgi:hypothetical protein
MKPKRNKSFVFLILITIVIILVGMSLVFTTGIQLNLIEVKLGASTNAKLFVIVFPVNSMVYVDGKQVGVTPFVMEIKPGTHTVQVEKQNYIKYEIKINAKSNEDIVVEYRLLHMPTIENVSFNATMPKWRNNDSLVFVSLDDGKLYLSSSLELKALVDNSLDTVFDISVSPQGEAITVMSSSGYSLHASIFSLTDGSFQDVGIGGALPVWLPTTQSFYFLGWKEDDAVRSFDGFHLWSGQSGGELDIVNLPRIENAFGAISTSWSSDSQYFMTVSDDLVDIWKFDGAEFTYIRRIESSYGAVWSPTGNQLAYLNSNGSMYVISEMEGSVSPKFIASNITPPLRWIPDSNQVVISTFSPVESGSSFWAVDVNNGARTLLADSSLILGRVTDFAISPDGTRIAYTNDLNHLNILFIGE